MLFCSKIIDFIAFGEHFPQYQRKGMYTASRQPSLTLVSMAYLGNNLDWLHLYNEWKATIDKQFDKGFHFLHQEFVIEHMKSYFRSFFTLTLKQKWMQLAGVNTEILARSVHSKQHVLLQMQYKFFFNFHSSLHNLSREEEKNYSKEANCYMLALKHDPIASCNCNPMINCCQVTRDRWLKRK